LYSKIIALRHQIAVLKHDLTRRALLASFGSAAVDLAVALVVRLARKPDDRPLRDGITLVR
jgi:hypothetical protein